MLCDKLDLWWVGSHGQLIRGRLAHGGLAMCGSPIGNEGVPGGEQQGLYPFYHVVVISCHPSLLLSWFILTASRPLPPAHRHLSEAKDLDSSLHMSPTKALPGHCTQIPLPLSTLRYLSSPLPPLSSAHRANCPLLHHLVTSENQQPAPPSPRD